MGNHVVHPTYIRSNVRSYVGEFCDKWIDDVRRVLHVDVPSVKVRVRTEYHSKDGVEDGGCAYVKVTFENATYVTPNYVYFNLAFSNELYVRSERNFWQFYRLEVFRRMYEELQLLDVVNAHNALVRYHRELQVGDVETCEIEHLPNPSFQYDCRTLFCLP